MIERMNPNEVLLRQVEHLRNRISDSMVETDKVPDLAYLTHGQWVCDIKKLRTLLDDIQVQIKGGHIRTLPEPYCSDPTGGFEFLGGVFPTHSTMPEFLKAMDGHITEIRAMHKAGAVREGIITEVESDIEQSF